MLCKAEEKSQYCRTAAAADEKPLKTARIVVVEFAVVRRSSEYTAV